MDEYIDRSLAENTDWFIAENTDGSLDENLGGHENKINANTKNFQPMNINFGLMPPLNIRVRKKKEKNALIAERALKTLENTLFEMEK